MKPSLYSAASVGCLLFAASASAHHAFNMYDDGKYLKLNGTIVNYAWKNPHVMIDYAVTESDGSVSMWSIECSSPNIIGRRGWTPQSVKTGDKVPLVVHPMKDGRKIALTVSATLPGGQVLNDKE